MYKKIFITLILSIFAVTLSGNSVSLKEKTAGSMNFIFIRGGSFMMGSPEGMGSEDEHPLHRVHVSSFWMGKFEVTQEQYEGVMGKNPSHFRGAGRPVESVSWRDADEFCARFSGKYGVKARLPYEAEWEYAARSGADTVYSWGNEFDGSHAWHGKNSGGGTHAPGGKNPGPWGLHDMSGNLWEWCMDWYDGRYYGNSPSDSPRGPLSGKFKVLRGGSWDLSGYYLRPASRERNDPGNRNNVLGFRVVIEK